MKDGFEWIESTLEVQVQLQPKAWIRVWVEEDTLEGATEPYHLTVGTIVRDIYQRNNSWGGVIREIIQTFPRITAVQLVVENFDGSTRQGVVVYTVPFTQGEAT